MRSYRTLLLLHVVNRTLRNACSSLSLAPPYTACWNRVGSLIEWHVYPNCILSWLP